MIEGTLFLIRYALVLAYGVALSAAFAGVEPLRKNVFIFFLVFAVSGIAQVICLLVFNEEFVWHIYPLFGHVPLIALLCLYYKKRLTTSLAAVTTAYLCCQPAKWAGLIIETLSSSALLNDVAAIITLVALGYVLLRHTADSFASIFSKDNLSVLTFSAIPIIYYAFDYAVSVYSDLWSDYSGAVAEFIPAVLSLAFVMFCAAYYQAIEEKMRSQEREKIVSVTVNQQSRELKAVRQGEQEMRLLRHDMRMLLGNVLRCLDEGDEAAARKLLTGYDELVEATKTQRWCGSDIVNYIISDCDDRCREAGIRFEAVVRMNDLPVDEVRFTSILSNALDNAVNAQEGLEVDARFVSLSLTAANGRLLLAVRNTYADEPVFVDGMPVTKQPGHGYGTQSIRYMTESLGGNCNFSVEDGEFVTRVVINL